MSSLLTFILLKADTEVSKRDKHRSQNGGLNFSRFEEVSSKF